MDKEQFISSGLIEQYVLGIASPEERTVVERFARKYPDIQKQLKELNKGLEAYARAHTQMPPPHLKNKVIDAMKVAAPTRSLHPERSPQAVASTWSKWIPAIAACMVLGLTFLCYLLYNNQKEAKEQIAVLSSQVEALQRDYQSLQLSDDRLKQQFAILKDVSTKHIQLQGSNLAPKAQAVVYWNNQHKDAYLNIVNLPEPPHNHQYQVWADVNGHHHDMGLLNTKPDSGAILYNLPYIEHSRGFVITLEKVGGSPHPTVEKLFAKGEMNSF